MVEVRGLTIEGLVQDTEWNIPEGTVCKIVTETDLGKHALLDTLSGLRRPDGGTVTLLGADIYPETASNAVQVFRDVGVVWRGGGMISNLRVWENIALPAEYHLGIHPSELEDKVRSLIECMGGASGGLMSKMAILPAHLLEYELTAAGLVRAMLMEPHLLIYDSIFEGLAVSACREMASCVIRFQSQLPGRTSVFITSDERSLEAIEADMVIRQKGTIMEQGGVR